MLITDQYRKLNRKLHEETVFGASGKKWALLIGGIMQRLKIQSMLDYGCGRGTIKNFYQQHSLFNSVTINEYDPAVPGKDTLPESADMVSVIDVLEHIEPKCLDDVLNHIYSLILKAGFFVICLRGSSNFLEDGTDTHRIIEPPSWWINKLEEHKFVIHHLDLNADKYFVCWVTK
jgi:hypothetical protein